MSTLRVSNIEAKADASSPTVNEKVKITNSNGDVMLQLDGATTGITTVGINTTTAAFTVDGAQNFNFVGVVTAASLSGNLTGNVTGNVTGNLTGTASTATAAATAYGLSGSPTLSGITSVSTSNLTVNGTAYPSAGPLSNRNLVINGAMQVAQRGTSQTGISDGATEAFSTLDRFRTRFSGGHSGVVTNSQSTTVPAGEGFSSSFKLDVTTAVASLTGSMRSEIQYKVEAQDLRNSGWNYTDTSSSITLSFWARSSKTGAHCIHLVASDTTTDKYYLAEYSLTAGTWERISIPIPGHANAVFDNDTNVGLEINWILSAGPDIDSGTSGAWHSTADRGTSNQVNVYDSTDGEFYLTGVQLEVGSVATPFEHRRYGDELLKCQRYFRRYCEGSTSKMAPCFVIGNSASTAYGSLNLSPSMRIVPSSDFASIKVDNVGSPKSITAVSVSANSSNDSLFLTFTVASGITYPTPYFILADGTSSARLDFSAEI